MCSALLSSNANADSCVPPLSASPSPQKPPQPTTHCQSRSSPWDPSWQRRRGRHGAREIGNWAAAAAALFPPRRQGLSDRVIPAARPPGLVEESAPLDAQVNQLLGLSSLHPRQKWIFVRQARATRKKWRTPAARAAAAGHVYTIARFVPRGQAWEIRAGPARLLGASAENKGSLPRPSLREEEREGPPIPFPAGFLPRNAISQLRGPTGTTAVRNLRPHVSQWDARPLRKRRAVRYCKITVSSSCGDGRSA